jgi:hypothetical protein
MLLWLKSVAGRPWVARIPGSDRKYGLAREFLAMVDKRPGERAYLVEEGELYQVQAVENLRYFITVKDGKKVILPIEKAMAMVQAMDAKKKQKDREIDEGLRRINFTNEAGYEEVVDGGEDEEE